MKFSVIYTCYVANTLYSTCHRMNIIVRDLFLQPALNLLPSLTPFRDSMQFSDTEFITLGVRRINTLHPTGRAFLQSVRQCNITDVSVKAYFGAAQSTRRLRHIHELNKALSRQVIASHDRFALFPEVADIDLLALDGHDIERATHEPAAIVADGRLESPDTTTGVFVRNLKTGAVRVLAQTQGHQHEWSAVKQRPWEDFLWDSGTKRTIYMIDAVAVDFEFLRGAKFKGRFTVITRAKKNLVVREARALTWDQKDPRNDGVLSDERVRYTDAGEFRLIRYQDPESGEIYELLTTEFHLAPGVIAQLYRLRWDIEKYFDVCENLWAERRAWGIGPVAAQVQNEFLVLTHNLLILLSVHLAAEGIRDEKVERKYAAALKLREAAAKLAGRKVSPWVGGLRQITRWSSQLTRWLQDAMIHDWNWQVGLEKLRPLMSDYMR